MIQQVKGHTSRMTKADRDALCEMAASYRAELLGEWGEKVHHDE